MSVVAGAGLVQEKVISSVAEKTSLSVDIWAPAWVGWDRRDGAIVGEAVGTRVGDAVWTDATENSWVRARTTYGGFSERLRR